jgi:hypothetical protein
LILDAATASIRITVSAAATAALMPGRYLDSLRAVTGEITSVPLARQRRRR